MSSITQTVQSYTGGISQQPDEKKLPGQVVDAINVLPDVTQGLQKRPGAELVASLSDNGTAALNSNTNGRWFHYYRDETEQYIGQINRAGDVNMWRCSDGASIAVSTESGQESAIATYLTHTNDADLQTLTLNDFTYITNRTIATGMTAETEPARPNEAYIAINKVAYSRQYSLNLFNDTSTQDVTTATRILVDLVASSNNYCKSDGAMVVRAAREGMSTRCDSNAGLSEDSLAPNTATKIFSINGETELTDEGVDDNYVYTPKIFNSGNNVLNLNYSRSSGTTTITHANHGYSTNDWIDANFSGSTTDGQYQITVTNANTYTVTDHYYTSGTNTGTVNISPALSSTEGAKRKSLYFQITTISQAIPSGSAGNIVYNARYTATHDLLYGGQGWQQNDYFYLWMKDGLYLIQIDEASTAKIQANLGLIRPQPTPFNTETTTTAEAVLGDIQEAIVTATKADGSNSVWNNAYSDVQIIGNGIYLTDAASFNVTAVDDELMTVMTSEVQSLDDLPGQCKHGYVVKVKNSDANEDDYYLRFDGDNNRDGRGSWTECAAPGRLIAFDPAKMPVQLVRQANGTFKLSQITWEKCLVGNTVTVPKPSFISTVSGTDDDDVTANRYINKMIFWRNRLVFLSEEDVILSQPGEFFNFWPKSSITYTANDVIDISCSSEFPADVYDGIQTNSGLVLFTKTKQFLLTTDSDVLSTQTAKLNAISAYNFNTNTNPISLGTTIAFLDNAGKYSRFWEMANIVREGEPQVIDQTKVVSKLFNKNLNKISNSRENAIIFFSEKNTQTLYGFTYFNSSEKRLQQAWFKWTFSGLIQHHCVLDDSLYLVIRDSGKDTMQRMPIKMDTNTLSITDDMDTTDTTDDITYRINLDNSKIIPAADVMYASDGRSKIFLPDGFNIPRISTDDKYKKLVIYCHQADSTSSDTQAVQDSDLIGSYTETIYQGPDSDGKYMVAWDGDWTGHDLILGYLFDMEVEFPTIYPLQVAGDNVKTTLNGSLILHRVKFNFGANGMYTTILDRIGKPQYSETWEPPLADSYKANKVGIHDQITQTVPIYERNKNLTLTLKSSLPAPATLYSMTWEGDFTNAYYKRV